MRQFVQRLHAAGQSWVPIVDPAVSVDAGNKAYQDGSKDKIWMRDHKGKTYVGQVGAGRSGTPLLCCQHRYDLAQ
jgi:alpha-glucosidase (family GH31 glycosyl hydrolase)